MQDYELDAWLGDTTATDDQRDALHRASDTIDAAYPGEDSQPDREAAFTGAAMLILGDSTLDQLGAALTHARQQQFDAVRQSIGGAIAAVHAGMTEAVAARTASIDRMTLRKALGK